MEILCVKFQIFYKYKIILKYKACFYSKIILCYVYECFVCMYVCIYVHACCPLQPEEGINPLALKLQMAINHNMGAWNLEDSSPLEEQQLILTT